MNIFIPIAIIVLLLIFFALKWNNFRTKFAFFLILSGAIFLVLLVFLFTSGDSFDFSNLGKFFTSVNVYLIWIKGFFMNVFEFTGRIIGLDVAPTNSTIFGG